MKVLIKKKPSFYDHLLEWELTHDLLAHFEELEHELAAQEMLNAIDHAINQAILDQLDRELHQEYLELCQQKYHDPSVLDWIQEKSRHDNVPGLIQETFITVYAQIKVELQQSDPTPPVSSTTDSQL